MLLSVIDHAEHGDFDVLIVARFDCFSCDYPSLALLQRRLQRHGVDLVSLADDNGDSAHAELMQGVLASVAEYTRRRSSVNALA